MTVRAYAASLPAGAAPGGTALEWSIGLTMVTAVLILALIAVSWYVYRGQQAEGGALWLHLLSLAVLPLFLLAVGNFATLEYVKEEQFCGSCHKTMKPFIDDMRNATSSSLASLHFQNRFSAGTSCYDCHANYGIHAVLEAKRTGLRHVYKYTTGTWAVPIVMKEPYENALCLKCHEGAKRFMAESLHLAADGKHIDPALIREKTSCIKCHGPAHAKKRKRGASS